MTSRSEKQLLSNILEKILFQWEQEDITLQKTHKLYFSAKDKYLSFNEEVKTSEVSEIMLKILFVAGKITEQFVEQWQNGKLKPTVKEGKLLEEGCNEVLAAFDNHFKKELSVYCVEKGKQFSAQHAKVKEKIKRIRKLLKESSY